MLFVSLLLAQLLYLLSYLLYYLHRLSDFFGCLMLISFKKDGPDNFSQQGHFSGQGGMQTMKLSKT